MFRQAAHHGVTLISTFLLRMPIRRPTGVTAEKILMLLIKARHYWLLALLLLTLLLSNLLLPLLLLKIILQRMILRSINMLNIGLTHTLNMLFRGVSGYGGMLIYGGSHRR